jgi:N-acetylmuramoyl-L-alanine amidase
MFMSEFLDREHPSTSPFVGLRPSRQSLTASGGARHVEPHGPAKTNRTLMATMPVVLVGSLAISSLGLAPPPEHAKADQRHKIDAPDQETAAPTIRPARAHVSASTVSAVASSEIEPADVAPATYTVRVGDTVSGIAGRYGLSTAVVLALNGLGWKSLIFPGQQLRLAKAAATAPQSPAPMRSVSAPTAAQPVTTPVVTTTPAPTANGSYVIQRGDTITAIAKRFGLTVSAVLAANNLVGSSIIYAGRTLIIPGAQITLASSVTTILSTSTTSLTPAMKANAQVIISVGRSLGVPDYGIVVALAAAAQESGLQNLNYGDRDSVGLFQQRPSTGWGTLSQLTTPSYAARLFFGGPSNPNRGRTRGLLDVAGWQSMTVTHAAQAVEISGSPNAYAKWEASARSWLAELG